ncbi:FMN-binding protein [Treponema sp. TIM-1]|uniref:FMN-binding protein n=1 Tax=Treponema sp. TIM-1 TaxID=2898417 RepID=UPI00397EE5E2
MLKLRPQLTRFLVIGVLSLFLVISCAINFAAIQAEMPDLRSKADGTYRGEYDLPKAPVKVTLEVRLENAQITGIEIVRHFCSPIGKKAEKITDRIIEKQSLQVDAISGATGSSKAILKAVEAALK